MSLQQADRVETPCKYCKFAKWDGITQVGCKANRLEGFGEDAISVEDEEKKFYVIKGLCPLYRPESWEGDLEKAIEQLKPSITVLIDLGNYSQKDLNDLSYNLSQCPNYNKCKIVLCHPESLNETDKRTVVIPIIKRYKDIIKVVEYKDSLTDIERDYEVSRYIKTSYFTVSIPTVSMVQNFLGLHTMLNRRGERIVVQNREKNTLYFSGVLAGFPQSGKRLWEYLREINGIAREQGLYFKYD